MVKLIIFDWDDVITLGAKEGYFKCYHKAISAVGVTLSPEEEKKRILAKWGKSFRTEIEELLKENPELVDEACRVYDKEFWGNTFVDSLRLVSGINETLLRLKNKYTLAVATGNDQKMLSERIIPKFYIPSVFSRIITSHEIVDQEKTKPNPYMLEVIMKEQNISPEETVFVGDAKTDVEMAFNAHVKPVVVLTGHLTRGEAGILGVDHIIDTATQIENILSLIH
ncbi:HAD family hydrolase [Candidatus Roizmanbacteria bacterium]|jgi:phosphoglycolate phosphatase|nr:MAG: HAD family hydrolase [Candidatus Roizmanbacteria bacterium]